MTSAFQPKHVVLPVFGTRPEVIKLAPVIWQLDRSGIPYRTVNVATGQHTALLYPFTELFGVRVDYDLRVMTSGQGPSGVCSRVLAALDPNHCSGTTRFGAGAG
jgi:UDP-N-acetylglucosamine 2-epimerase (non-hydrolysing)